MCDTGSDPRWGWFGSGPRQYILRGSAHETSPVQRRVGLEPWFRLQSDSLYMTTIMISGAIQGGVAAHHQVCYIIPHAHRRCPLPPPPRFLTIINVHPRISKLPQMLINSSSKHQLIFCSLEVNWLQKRMLEQES